MKVRKETVAITLSIEVLVICIAALAFYEGRRYPGSGAILGAIVMTLPLVLERIGWFRMPIFMQVWASMAVGLHILGLGWGLYDTLFWWDELTHLVSSSMVGMLVALGLYLFDMHSIKIDVPRWAYPLMIFVFLIFAGTIWEIAEFVGDLVLGGNMQYSLPDTLHDFFMDLLGGMITGVLWVLWLWRDPSNEMQSTALHPLLNRLRSFF
jgi:hypothetical protein